MKLTFPAQYLLIFLIIVILWILNAGIFGFGYSFDAYYFGVAVSDFLSTSIALIFSTITTLVLTVTHRKRSKTFLFGISAYLICILLSIAVGYYTLDSGFLFSSGAHSFSPQKLDSLTSNVISLYCLGFSLGAANGLLFRKMVKNKRSFRGSLIAVSTALISGIISTPHNILQLQAEYSRITNTTSGILRTLISVPDFSYISPAIYICIVIWLCTTNRSVNAK
jgi:hypothetical protein